MIKANNYTLISSEIYLLNILYRYFIYKAKSDDNRINKIIKAPSKSPKPFVKWVGGK